MCAHRTLHIADPSNTLSCMQHARRDLTIRAQFVHNHPAEIRAYLYIGLAVAYASALYRYRFYNAAITICDRTPVESCNRRLQQLLNARWTSYWNVSSCHRSTNRCTVYMAVNHESRMQTNRTPQCNQPVSETKTVRWLSTLQMCTLYNCGFLIKHSFYNDGVYISVKRT